MSLGVTSVMAERAVPPLTMALLPIDAATMAQYGTIQSGCDSELCNNSGQAQYSWVCWGCGIFCTIWRYIASVHSSCSCSVTDSVHGSAQQQFKGWKLEVESKTLALGPCYYPGLECKRLT